MVIAVAIALGLGHSFPDYDSAYALVWGRDLAQLQSPELHLAFAPAARPLWNWLAGLYSLAGEAAAVELMRWTVLLAAGALVAAVYRIGRDVFGLWAGVLAAALLATRTPFSSLSILYYVDVPAAALVAWAVALEVRRPRRGVPVLVLLGLAGLLRPEAWLLAGAYWLWLVPALPRARAAALAAAAAAAPVLWAVNDLIVAGEPLTSFRSPNATQSEAAASGASRLPGALADNLGGFLRPPAAIAALVGVAAALWLLRVARSNTATGSDPVTRLSFPLALVVLNVIAFVVIGLGGGPLEQRYLLPAAAGLCLFAAVGCLGWVALAPDDPRRRPWRIGGLILLLAVVAYTPVDGDRLHDLRANVRAADEVQDDLRALAQERRVPAVRCGLRSVSVNNVRMRPLTAWWTERPASAVVVGAPAPGALEPASSLADELQSRSLPRDTAAAHLLPSGPPDYALAAQNASWRLFVSPGACPA